MIAKTREKPFELQQLEALRGRIVFSPEQERLSKYLKTGFVGECMSDELVENSAGGALLIRDLLLMSGGRTCQIDSLMIADGKVYLFEIKNWEGSFEILDGKFVGLSACPLAQLQRTKMIVEHLLSRYGFRVEVEERLLFMNPKMNVYGLMRQHPLLLLHQIEPYCRSVAGGYVYDKWDKKIADFLVEQHVSENRYANTIVFDSAAVQCGVMCGDCRVRMRPFDLLKLECPQCRKTESKRECLARSKAEMEVLFGNQRYPKHALIVWCDGLISRRMLYD